MTAGLIEVDSVSLKLISELIRSSYFRGFTVIRRCFGCDVIFGTGSSN